MATLFEPGVEKPLISISVVSFNDSAEVEHLLSSLADGVPLDAPRIEVLVHENGKTAPSVASPADHISVHVTHDARNIGFGAGHNRNGSRALGDFFLILNPDVAISSGACVSLVKALFATAGGAVAPRLMLPNSATQATVRRLPRLRYEFGRLTGLDRVSRLLSVVARPPWTTSQVEQVAGAAILLRTDEFRRIGGFDEDFFLYFEDVDFCRRVRERIGSIYYVPSIEAAHKAEGTARRYRWQTTALIELSRVLYYEKTAPSSLRMLRYLTMVNCIVRGVVHQALGVVDGDSRSKAKGFFWAARHLFSHREGIVEIRARLDSSA